MGRFMRSCSSGPETALVLGVGFSCGLEQAAAAGPTNGVPAPSGLVSWWRGEGTATDSAGEADGVLYRG